MNFEKFNDLVKWYKEQCNGDWEHAFGISIQTLDNPGWCVEIDLKGTPLEGAVFEERISGDFSDNNPSPPWLHCKVLDNKFDGAGDTNQLANIVEIFLSWDESIRRLKQTRHAENL